MSNDVWSEVFLNQEWGKYPTEPLIRFVAKNFYSKDRSSVRFLELGCGPGANLWYLAREGFSFLGIDGSEVAIAQASKRLDDECPNWRDNSDVIVGDVSCLSGIAEESFDAVIDAECVCCLPFETSCQVYQQAKSLLKTGGRIFIKTFCDESWGYGTGKKVAEHMYECSEGPLENKGGARFTKREQIPTLMQGYQDVRVEKTTMTHMDGCHCTAEWIIEAKK